MITLSHIKSALRAFVDGRAGAATVEFVMMVPVFVFLFVSSFEVAVLNIRQLLLERGLDIAVRELRLGTYENATSELIRYQICQHDANFIANCESEVLVELIKVVPGAWNLPDPNATCVNRGETVQPVTTFDPGTDNELMIVRACLLVDPFFPGTELAMMLEGETGSGIALTASSAFVIEPGQGD